MPIKHHTPEDFDCNQAVEAAVATLRALRTHGAASSVSIQAARQIQHERREARRSVPSRTLGGS